MAAGVGRGEMVGATGHDRDAASATPRADRSAATSRDGTTERGLATATGVPQCRLVPARAAPVVASGCRRHAMSCTVTTSRSGLAAPQLR